MKFPNAAKGVKKIFTAEILSLIGQILAAVSTIAVLIAILTSGITVESLKTGNGFEGLVGFLLIAGIAWIIMGIFMFIAMIIRIVGIAQARRDEDNFTAALVFQIMSIVTTLLTIFLPIISVRASGFLDSVTTLLDVFVVILVISGIIKLSDKLNNGEIARKGVNILKLIIMINVFGLLGTLIASFMGGTVASVAAAVIALIAAVLSVVQYIMYLSFLSKAKKMLEKS